MIILLATDQEYDLAKKYLDGHKIIKTGVGASNVIKVCSDLLIQFALSHKFEPVINVGFCGSNKLPKGTVTEVYRTFRFIDHTVGFVDYRNGWRLSDKGYDCYTNNDFVTEDDNEDQVLYDMELNYIAAFPLRLIGSVKIVSDNLCVNEYAECIHASTKETWREVRRKVEDIARRYEE